MYAGEYECQLDSRNRFVLPEPFLAILAEESLGSRSMVFMGGEAIYIYSVPGYSKLLRGYCDQIVSGKFKKDARSKLLRTMMRAYCKRVKHSRKGRAMIPKAIAISFDLTKSSPIYIVGFGDHIQIWKKEQWQDQGSLDKYREWNLSCLACDYYQPKKKFDFLRKWWWKWQY